MKDLMNDESTGFAPKSEALKTGHQRIHLDPDPESYRQKHAGLGTKHSLSTEALQSEAAHAYHVASQRNESLNPVNVESKQILTDYDLTKPQSTGLENILPEGLRPEQLNKIMVDTIPGNINYEPTKDEIAVFDKLAREKKGDTVTVIKEIVRNGRRALVIEDNKTHKRGVMTLGGSPEFQNLYLAPDPETENLENETILREWVEGLIREQEGLGVDLAIDPTFEQSLLQTIANIPGRARHLLGVPNVFGDGTPIPNMLINELRHKVRGRFAYHNAAIKAKFSPKELRDTIMGRPYQEHAEILNTPGVQEILGLFINDEGEYFRLIDDVEEDAYRSHAVDALQGMGIADPNLAFELAVKSMHIWGESARYVQPRIINAALPAGAPPGMHPPGVEVMVEESNQFGAPLDYEDYLATWAAFYPQYWDEMVRLPLGLTQTALQLAQNIHYPVAVSQGPAPGEARYMQRFAFTWLGSAVSFRRKANIIEFMSDPGAIAGSFRWGSAVAAVSDNRGVFNEKGEESLLNTPLIEPNAARTSLSPEDRNKVLEAVMKNYLGAIAAYGHLSLPLRKVAMSFLATGVLRYVNYPERRTDGDGKFINWRRWDSRTRDDVLDWLVKVKNVLTRDQANAVKEQLRVSDLARDTAIVAPLLGEGLIASFRHALGSILRTK